MPGEVLGIAQGESGCGKSVSSLAVMGLLSRRARITGIGPFSRLPGASGRRRRRPLQDPWRQDRHDLSRTRSPRLHTGFYRWRSDRGAAVRIHREYLEAKRFAMSRAVDLLNLAHRHSEPRSRERGRFPARILRRDASARHDCDGDCQQPEVNHRVNEVLTTALDVTIQAQILDLLQRKRKRRPACRNRGFVDYPRSRRPGGICRPFDHHVCGQTRRNGLGR